MKLIATLTLVLGGCSANQQQSNTSPSTETQADDSGVGQPAKPEAPVQTPLISEAEIEAIVEQMPQLAT